MNVYLFECEKCMWDSGVMFCVTSVKCKMKEKIYYIQVKWIFKVYTMIVKIYTLLKYF